MKLFPNESVILETKDKLLTLTNYRVRYFEKTTGSANLISILLKHVSGCSFVKHSNTLFLYLSILTIIVTIIFGVSGQENIYFYVSIICLLLFSLLYYFSIKKYLIIASSGSKIEISANKLKTEFVIEFVDTLEALKVNNLN